MFELKITSLQEFKVFIGLIRNEPIDPEEVAKLLPGLEEATTNLINAEKTQEG